MGESASLLPGCRCQRRSSERIGNNSRQEKIPLYETDVFPARSHAEEVVSKKHLLYYFFILQWYLYVGTPYQISWNQTTSSVQIKNQDWDCATVCLIQKTSPGIPRNLRLSRVMTIIKNQQRIHQVATAQRSTNIRLTMISFEIFPRRIQISR